MYSQTCIEWSSSGDGVPQNKSNIKNNKKMPFYVIIDHFMHKNLLKILLKLNLGEKHGLRFPQKIIFSFN